MQSSDRALKQAQSSDDISSMPRPNGGPILVSYTSSNLGTRRAMQALLDGLRPVDLSPTDAGHLEVALVEVLNNIVKHAYCGHDTGLIEITCQPFDDFLSFDIVDAGLQMPDRCVPDNPLPRTNFPGTLPEGGFGWFLIRQLSYDIDYSRPKDINHLHLKIRLEDPAHLRVGSG